nr:uncharacterized protein LOC108119518 isoform X1 [Drosophila bipectinata]
MLDFEQFKKDVDQILRWQPTAFPSATPPETPKVPSLFDLAAAVLSKRIGNQNIDYFQDQEPHDLEDEALFAMIEPSRLAKIRAAAPVILILINKWNRDDVQNQELYDAEKFPPTEEGLIPGIKMAMGALDRLLDVMSIVNVPDQEPTKGSEHQELQKVKYNLTEPATKLELQLTARAIYHLLKKWSIDYLITATAAMEKNEMQENGVDTSESERKVNYRRHLEDEDPQRNPQVDGPSAKKLKK